MKKTLIKAMKAAGEIHLKYFKAVKNISVKENFTSIVTEADVESERKIIEVIEKEYPGHNILSEESGFTGRNSIFTWVIDPIDGTSNYAAGLPWFGALVALLKSGKPILAGAYMPVQDYLYLAEDGLGATLNGQILKMPSVGLKEALSSFSTNYTPDEDYQHLAVQLYTFLVQNTRNVRTTNCLVDLLNVAEGKFSGSVMMFGGIWDIAAPYLIIREAGGVTKNLDSTEVDFTIDDQIMHKNFPVITGSEWFVEQVLLHLKTLKR